MAFANSGADLALLDMSVDRQEETKSKCEKFGAKVQTYACNITDATAVHDTFEQIVSSLGPVDILVNNAGVTGNKFAVNETFNDFWRVMEVNLKGPALCIYEVIKSMKERKTGCIINMSSRSATVDMPTGLSYNSSKAAIVRVTGTLQAEFDADGLGEQVHCYALHPGGVWTDLFKG